MLEVTREEMGVMVRLQENEDRKNRTRQFLRELPEQFARLDEEIAALEDRLQEEETRLSRQKQAYRDCEDKISTKQESIKKSDQKLLSIKNNKEYQAVLTEIEGMKTDIAALEDEMLDLLFAVEAAEQDLAAARKAAEASRQQIAEERRDLEKQQAAAEEKLAALETDGNTFSEQLPGPLLDQYLEVRRSVPGGQAVAAVKNFICQGCNMNIPPQMYNELHTTNVLRFCPFCSRIIYYNGNNQE
ncbi:MAG: zinc ribbon domain-containing protein [Desulfosudaceae bacterium]